MPGTDALTAKQRHRLAVFGRYHRPRCELADVHPCVGPLQADHIIEVRRLIAAKAQIEVALLRPLPPQARIAIERHPLVLVSEDALVADGRNGWILCEGTYGLKTAALIQIERHRLPPCVEDFATEFQIEHLLDRYFEGQR